MLFTFIHDTPSLITVCLCDGTLKLVDKIGNVMLTSSVILQNVLYAPDFKHNLLSIEKLLDQNQ